MPYRSLATLPVPKRSLRCWLRLCSMRADGSLNAIVCERCGRTRGARGQDEHASLDHARQRHEALLDRARWCFEMTEWERGGKVGPRPRSVIPGPGQSIYL